MTTSEPFFDSGAVRWREVSGSVSAFTRAFVQGCGETPSSYRRRVRS
jgi:hypothetical protein